MTYELTAREEALGMLSDIHKDAYGYRPRGKYSPDITIEDIYAEIDRLHVIATQKFERERREEEINSVKFEGLIQRTICMGADSRETALRWLLQADDEHYDVEYFVWKQGLGCGEVARPYVQEILPIAQQVFGG